MAKLGRYEF